MDVETQMEASWNLLTEIERAEKIVRRWSGHWAEADASFSAGGEPKALSQQR